MIENQAPPPETTSINSGLSPLLKYSTWAALFWESLWPRLVPFFMVACVFLIFSWLGLWELTDKTLGSTGRWVVLGAFALLTLYALRHLFSVKFPDRNTIIRRIEAVSQLQHRPLTAQSDPQATGNEDALSTILWQEHQRRMADQLQNMTAGSPKPDASQFDKYAIRAALPVLAFAAFLYSFGNGGGQLVDAITPPLDREALLTRLDIWINPPAYTRKPPIYLSKRKATDADNAISAPQDSEFYLRYIGKSEIELHYVGPLGRQLIEPTDTATKSGETEFKFPLKNTGLVELSANGETLSQWPLNIIKDTPPTIKFTKIPDAALSGSLQLNYEMTDDYGVLSAKAEIQSLEETDPKARPLVDAPKLPLPLPRQRTKTGKAKVNRDLTKHPLAGSRVSITLVALDDAGQEGRSISHEMDLPGRKFSKPLALALVEQRRILALDARKLPRVANLLDAVSSVPDHYINNPTAKIAMRVAYQRLLSARNDDELRDTLDLMWDIALAIEFGDLSEAERKLREAQERLSKALEENASPEEIEKLMQELRQAMNDFMQQMMEQARNNPLQQNPFDQNNQTQTLTQRDIEKMMDRIEDLAKSGSKDAARELLAEMQRMMDNLRTSQHQQQRRQEGNQMNKALDKLSELMQQQQKLLNETFKMQRQDPANRQNQQQQSQDKNQERQNEKSQNQQGQNQEPMTPEEFAKALEQLKQQQEALKQQLGELGEQLEGMGLDPSEQFGKAMGEMGEAGKNLGKGSTGAATSNQAKALEALKQGAQQMMQQMAGDRQPGGQQPGDRGQGRSGARKTNDPLGRNRPGDGRNTGDETKVPDEIDAQIARQILEAIRKRLSIPTQPLIEKDYLERLLESR